MYKTIFRTFKDFVAQDFHSGKPEYVEHDENSLDLALRKYTELRFPGLFLVLNEE